LAKAFGLQGGGWKRAKFKARGPLRGSDNRGMEEINRIKRWELIGLTIQWMENGHSLK
jgi:hypothetical protein